MFAQLIEVCGGWACVIRYAGCGYVRCLSLWVSLFVCARHCDIMLSQQLRVASVLLCVGVGGRDCGERCQCEHLCVVVAIVPHVCSFRSVLLCEWMSVLITSDLLCPCRLTQIPVHYCTHLPLRTKYGYDGTCVLVRVLNWVCE